MNDNAPLTRGGSTRWLKLDAVEALPCGPRLRTWSRSFGCVRSSHMPHNDATPATSGDVWWAPCQGEARCTCGRCVQLDRNGSSVVDRLWGVRWVDPGGAMGTWLGCDLASGTHRIGGYPSQQQHAPGAWHVPDEGVRRFGSCGRSLNTRCSDGDLRLAAESAACRFVRCDPVDRSSRKRMSWFN